MRQSDSKCSVYAHNKARTCLLYTSDAADRVRAGRVKGVGGSTSRKGGAGAPAGSSSSFRSEKEERGGIRQESGILWRAAVLHASDQLQWSGSCKLCKPVCRQSLCIWRYESYQWRRLFGLCYERIRSIWNRTAAFIECNEKCGL